MGNKRPEKCTGCYKWDWCMLTYDQSFECLGAFRDVQDNAEKFSKWCDSEGIKK